MGLSNVPNENLKPLYYYNSGSRTLNTPRIMTRMDYAAAANVTYTIDASMYAVGDQFEIARLADSAGEITIALNAGDWLIDCLLYTSPSPRDNRVSRMPSSA